MGHASLCLNHHNVQAARSLSGELPAAVAAAAMAAAAMAATSAEEKPVLSLFDKIRGKRRTSVDSPMLPKASAHRLSLDGGIATLQCRTVEHLYLPSMPCYMYMLGVLLFNSLAPSALHNALLSHPAAKVSCVAWTHETCAQM